MLSLLCFVDSAFPVRKKLKSRVIGSRFDLGSTLLCGKKLRFKGVYCWGEKFEALGVHFDGKKRLKSREFTIGVQIEFR